ncbi:hypothetical protein ACIBLA_24515 [Streptomyces sp. NPDC050433]|uniref:hypothetical protein n=1 Tax=unclassified Streptomyces TaxID=2593676 RepID=UPI00343C878B
MTETNNPLADALEVREAEALAAYRESQANSVSLGVPHDEAFRRVFGEDAT